MKSFTILMLLSCSLMIHAQTNKKTVKPASKSTSATHSTSTSVRVVKDKPMTEAPPPAANQFNITKDGIAPVVLNYGPAFTASKIYERLKTWNPAVVKYPQATVRVDIPDTEMKYAGHIDEAWRIHANNIDNWYVLEYILRVEIKDGRCRVSLETPETRYKVWYNPNGSTIDKFKDSERTFEASVNKMLSSLNEWIINAPKKSEDNW